MQSRLGALLVAEGVVSQERLDQLLAQQRTTGRMLGEMLVEQGVIDNVRMQRLLAKQLGVPFCQLRHGLVDFALMSLMGPEEAERLTALPMFKVHDTLTVAMAEPQSLPKIDRLHQLTRCQIRPVLAPRENILEYVKKFASGNTDVDAFLASLSQSEVDVVENESVDDGPATNLDKMVEGSPIVNLVNMALMTAIKDRASDIHIEPDKQGSRIRYRIDGTLRDLMKPPPAPQVRLRLWSATKSLS
jgi:type IV pilus assembly protein PilB